MCEIRGLGATRFVKEKKTLLFTFIISLSFVSTVVPRAVSTCRLKATYQTFTNDEKKKKGIRNRNENEKFPLIAREKYFEKFSRKIYAGAFVLNYHGDTRVRGESQRSARLNVPSSCGRVKRTVHGGVAVGRQSAHSRLLFALG